jgi:hypothetical protein
MRVIPHACGVTLRLGSLSLELDHVAAEQLHEEIGRALMPGQPLPEAPTRAEVDRCGYSDDPYHRCRVCYDYAAGRERDHPLTAGAPAAEAREHG